MPVIITGAPRSGTKYVSQVLSQYDLKVSHETWKNDLDVFVDWHEVPVCRRGFDYVHLVREPLRCISSMQTISIHSRDYFKRYCPSALPYRADTLSFLCECWLCWTETATNRATEGTFQLESLANPRHAEEFVDACTGWHGITVDLTPFLSVSKKTNSREHTNVTLKMLEELSPQHIDPILRAYDKFGYIRPTE